MMDDVDFQLCLDIDDYAAKAREDKRQSASAASCLDGEDTGKRKIDDMDSSDEMDIDDGSIGPSASKKVKAYASGEEECHQDSSSPLVHGLGDQTPDLEIEGDNEAPREPFTSPSTPLTRTTVTTACPAEDTDIAVDTDANLVSNETLLSGSETVNQAPPSRLPYGHLIADIPVPVLTEAEHQAEEIRRHRRRQERGLIDFEIYEDAQARQDLLTEIHLLQDDPTDYSSPRDEDKENSDESFEQLDSDGDDADNELEDDDDEEEDEDESEYAESESEEDTRQNPEYLPSSSNSSRVTLAELIPFSDQMVQRYWRYSVFSPRRGRR